MSRRSETPSSLLSRLTLGVRQTLPISDQDQAVERDMVGSSLRAPPLGYPVTEEQAPYREAKPWLEQPHAR